MALSALLQGEETPCSFWLHHAEESLDQPLTVSMKVITELTPNAILAARQVEKGFNHQQKQKNNCL
eukprot:6287037-Amphidinium_carterae.1